MVFQQMAMAVLVVHHTGVEAVLVAITHKLDTHLECMAVVVVEQLVLVVEQILLLEVVVAE
jgi:hypothetical protein